MPPDDGDIVRATGYVAIYCGHLESRVQEVCDCLGDNVNVSSKAPTSVKAKACLEAIAAIDENLELEDLRGLLEDTEILLRRRNEIMHGLLSMTKQGLIRANPRTGDQTLVTASDAVSYTHLTLPTTPYV